MIGDARLRERLGDLVRSRRAAPASVPGSEPFGTMVAAANGCGAAARSETDRLDKAQAFRSEAVGVEEYLPGGEWRTDRGPVYVHERLRSTMERSLARWGTLGAPSADEPDLLELAEHGLERALFLDLETGGLASSPVFLAGTMHWNGSDFVLRQYFARHYGEEGALIHALNEEARGFEFLVTFNGKSYDVPFLTGRSIVHAVPLELPARHVDLLHPSRRRWKDRLPDCRLQTLELHVCRRRRVGDVPSEEVPFLYHDFVRHGDPYRLVPVFHHNLLDVITMGEVLRALCDGTGREDRVLSEG